MSTGSGAQPEKRPTVNSGTPDLIGESIGNRTNQDIDSIDLGEGHKIAKSEYEALETIANNNDIDTERLLRGMKVNEKGFVLQADFSECYLLNLNGIADLSNLTSLGLTYNQISDISPLAHLTNLTYLRLSYNQISDISPIGSLTSIEKVILMGNQIYDISPLKGLNKLKELWLDDNQISDISPLKSLPNLIKLGLEFNQLSEDSKGIIDEFLGRGMKVLI